MSAPAICPACARENRIATVAGPTCPHHQPTGAAWFPENYDRMLEADRIVFIQQLNTKKNAITQ